MIQFGSSVVAGTVLVRSAIQSPNYIAGVSGWAVNQDGSVEFNNAVIRGSIEAGGGTVRLNAGGVKVDGPTTQYDINVSAGFLARLVPDDGTIMQMFPTGLFMSAQDPSPLGTAVDSAFIGPDYVNSGAANETPYLGIVGPNYTGKSDVSMFMYGQAANDANPDNTSHIDIFADQINFFPGSTRPDVQKGEYGSFLLSFGPATSATVVVTYAKAYTSPPIPLLNIDSGAGATARWVARAISRSSTTFTYFVFAADGAAGTWVNVSCSWMAFAQV